MEFTTQPSTPVTNDVISSAIVNGASPDVLTHLIDEQHGFAIAGPSQAGATGASQKTCSVSVMELPRSFPEDVFVVGKNFMENYEVVFDLDKQLIGIVVQ